MIAGSIYLDLGDLGGMPAEVRAERSRALLQTRTPDCEMKIKDVFKGCDHGPWPAAELIILARTLRILVRNADHRVDPILNLFAHVKQSRPSGAAHPFVRIAGKRVHTPIGEAELHHAGAVRAVDKAQDVLAVSQHCQLFHRHVATVTAERVGEMEDAGLRRNGGLEGAEDLLIRARHRKIDLLDDI